MFHSLLKKSIFCLGIVFFLTLNFTLSFSNTEASAKTTTETATEASATTPIPFIFQTFWNLYEDNENNIKYQVLTLQLTSQNGYYTYAPNQEGMYPTQIDFAHIDATANLAPTQNPITLYPIGKKKADPFNPSVQIYAYEDTQYIFLLFPANFLQEYAEPTKEASQSFNLMFSFLACTNEHCLPSEEIIPLDLNTVDINNLQNIKNAFFYTEFQNLAQLQNLTQAQTAMTRDESKGLRLKESLAQKEHSKAPAQEQEHNKEQEQSLNTRLDYHFTPQPLNTSLEVQSLYKALLFGLLAGFILNFMPCVLPVIGLKIRSFLQSKKEDDTEEAHKKRLSAFREHNLFFGFGILTWFLVLGFLLGVLGFSWGQIFQNPSVVLTLTLFIFAMSLSLFGIYHLPIFGTKIVHILVEKPNNATTSKTNKTDTQNKDTQSKVQKKDSEKFSAFASGLLATLLATPCSGPLLGAVLGYSLTQPLPILLTIFLAMGFGMALPYFLFALRPSLVRFMPRAGNWLNNMEQILGFFLIATSIYLFSLLPEDWQMPALILTFCLSISCTLWGKMGSFHSKGIKKALIGLLCIVCVLLPSVFLFQTKETKAWIDFTPQMFHERLGKELLILKFTADWCPTCKVLEHTVFTTKNMQELSATTKTDSSFVYVDLTEFEETKQNLLKALDSVSIPLLAIFPKGERAYEPIIIRDMYTLDQVKEAIKLAQ